MLHLPRLLLLTASLAAKAPAPPTAPPPEPSTEPATAEAGAESEADAARRQQAIEALRKAVQAGKADAAGLHRLGDLYLEAHWAQPAPAAGAPEARLAAEQYQAVLTDHPKYPATDEVLLGLGEALTEIGKATEAAAAFRRLVDEFPKSKAAGDAWLALARQAYDTGRQESQLTEAREALRKALEAGTREPIAAHALLGAVENALGEYASALRELALTASLAEPEEPETAGQARHDFVAVYVRAGDPLKAVAELKKVGGGPYAWDMLVELANAYHEVGRRADATRLFQQLMKERPTSPDVPLFHCHLAGYLMRGTDRKAILAAMEALAASIRKVEAEGDFTREADRRSFEQARRKAEAMLHTLSLTWHETAQASGDPVDVMDAEQMCGLYLGLFAKDAPKEIRRCSQGY